MMITGDNKHAAFKVARHVGIELDDVVYQAYPEDKKKTVEKLQADNEKVMFVGDGINDSPVLAQANVGVAINSGSDITVDAASIVLMKDNLCDVINALRISRMSFRRIKINFVWAFMYNLLLVPIAMGVLYPINRTKLDPMLAGAAMAMSSISVVISSLLLKCYTPYESSKKRKMANRRQSNGTKQINESSNAHSSDGASQFETEESHV